MEIVMRKMVHSLLLVMLFMVMVTLPAYAQEEKVITLDQAIDMAIKHSNSIKQKEYDIEKGEEYLKAALSNLSIPSGQAEPQVAAAWTAALNAQIGLQMAKESKKVEEDRIALDVFNNYTEVLSANQSLKLAELKYEKVKKDWQIALLSYDCGAISQSQLKLAEYGQKTAQASYELSKKEVEKAYQNFNSLIGLSLSERPLLLDGIEYTPIDIVDLDHEIARIMDKNPAIWLAEQQVELAEIQLDLYNWADPLREPYEVKKIDIEKAKLTATDGKQLMKNSLYSLHKGIVRLEDSYAIACEALKMAQEDFRVKEVQYELGMLSKQDYMASKLALTEAENNLNKIVYQHESLIQTFYKPWAAST
jgi:outer membrane protein